MTADRPSPFRVLHDTVLNWAGDVVWLLPHQVQDHHVPLEGDPKPPVAPTTRDADMPTHLERINDWPGTDASGEGTSIWHPEGMQQPAPEADMTPEEMLADLKEFFRPIREHAMHMLERAKQPLPPVPTTRSIMAQQAASDPMIADGIAPAPGEPVETKAYSDVIVPPPVVTPVPSPSLVPPTEAIPPDAHETVLPYKPVLTKGLAGEDRWDVVDAAGHSAGYVKDEPNSEAGAQARADFLNSEPNAPASTDA
jgi:hypothetical protein